MKPDEDGFDVYDEKKAAFIQASLVQFTLPAKLKKAQKITEMIERKRAAGDKEWLEKEQEKIALMEARLKGLVGLQMDLGNGVVDTDHAARYGNILVRRSAMQIGKPVKSNAVPKDGKIGLATPEWPKKKAYAPAVLVVECSEDLIPVLSGFSQVTGDG